ncbi:site-2 protease family protein [Paenibacillus motobuensis]
MNIKRLLRPLPFFLILILIGVLTVLLFPASGKAITLAALIFSAFLFAVLAHESGHLLIGTLAGLKPEEMVVGPIMIVFTGGSIRLRPNNSWLRFGGTMRFTACSADLNAMARRWSWMALGGPAASLITALLILILPPFWPLFKELLLWISLTLGAATIFPLSNGSSHSDGKLFLLLHKRSARAHLLMAGVILQKDYLSERQPAEWNSEIINAAAQLLKGLPERTPEQLAEEIELRMYLYLHYADKGQPEEALKYIRPVCLTKHPYPAISVSRIMIDSLYAGHLLLYPPQDTRSCEEAEALVKSLPNNEPYSYHKAWAALLSVQGNKEEAMEHLSQARILLDRWFRPFGTYRLERNILSQIENQL